MIRDTLAYVANNYEAAAKESFSQHSMANYLRHDAKNAISEALSNPYYLCKGSPGQGTWADVPWIGVFDPAVTDSATRGYYVVYLFSADMKEIYLCLAQGTTAVREEFKNETHDALRRFAGLMRDRVPEAKKRFSGSPIVLGGTTTLAKDYEPSIALNIRYKRASLPDETTLVADLRDMVRCYATLISRGGRDTFEDTAPQEAEIEGVTIVERRRYRQHRKIERRSKAAKLAKEIHGYVCQCCGMDFGAIYGQFGALYIEAHHLIPLSELPEDVPVTQDPRVDFAVLCANCHRMIHRKDGPQKIAALRELPGVRRLRLALDGLIGSISDPN